MRAKRKAYNLISNNCQNFALNMLDAIQVAKHKEFGTTLAIYQRATGKGSVSQLFLEKLPEAEAEEEEDQRPPEEVLQNAFQVMDEHTTKLDTHHSFQ